jgi:hypothetical protein
MSCEEAGTFLSKNHVRYVVVDRNAAVQKCMPEGEPRATFGTLLLYDRDLTAARPSSP